VADGLLGVTTIFAMAAFEAETELVVNNSQLQTNAIEKTDAEIVEVNLVPGKTMTG
jgi:hypothetical protein